MWISDPKDNKPSVSLTLLIISFLLVIGAVILEVLGKIDTTSISAEIFFGCAATYFGRRISFNKLKIENKDK